MTRRKMMVINPYLPLENIFLRIKEKNLSVGRIGRDLCLFQKKVLIDKVKDLFQENEDVVSLRDNVDGIRYCYEISVRDFRFNEERKIKFVLDIDKGKIKIH
jgi:hypothetical protein